MAAVRRQFDVSCSSSSATCYFAKHLLVVLVVFEVPRSMVWAILYEARACIPTICLKFLVICLANALLATGWLLLSILSITSEFLLQVLGVPPTLPKLPQSPPPSPISAPRVRQAIPKVKEASSSAPAHDPVTQHASGEPAAATHVKFINPPVNVVVLPRAPPTVPPTRLKSPPEPAIPEEGPSNGYFSLPIAQSDSEHSDHALSPERGRKLSLFTKRFVIYGSPSRARLRTPPQSGQSSPARSPERPDISLQPGVKRCVKTKSSQDAIPKPPAPRTNPYQAPYFFPSPLSPEAADYVHRVRSERVPNASSEPRPRPPRSSSLGVPSSPTVEPRKVPARSATEKGRKGVRRSWHLSFHRDEEATPMRKSSWDSEVATLHNSAPGSTERIPSPVASTSSNQGRDESNPRPRRITLSPLQSGVALEVQAASSAPPSPTATSPKSKKHWPFSLRHHRSHSETSNASHPQQPATVLEAERRSKSKAKAKSRKTV